MLAIIYEAKEECYIIKYFQLLINSFDVCQSCACTLDKALY